MPRRMIESDIWFNEKVASLPDAGRLLFIGIFSNADDDGRLLATPKYLKAHIFPYDEEKTVQQITEWRELCVNAGLIEIYNNNGREILQIPAWQEHQTIRADRYKPSKLPPPDNLSLPTRQPVDNQIGNQMSTTGGRSIDKDRIDKVNIEENAIIAKSPLGEETKKVFALLDRERGYKPPKRKGEAASIIRMLKSGYIPEQIISVWKELKQNKFYQDKELFMMTVESQIGAKVKGNTPDKRIKEKYSHIRVSHGEGEDSDGAK